MPPLAGYPQTPGAQPYYLSPQPYGATPYPYGMAAPGQGSCHITSCSLPTSKPRHTYSSSPACSGTWSLYTPSPAAASSLWAAAPATATISTAICSPAATAATSGRCASTTAVSASSSSTVPWISVLSRHGVRAAYRASWSAAPATVLPAAATAAHGVPPAWRTNGTVRSLSSGAVLWHTVHPRCACGGTSTSGTESARG